MSRVKRGTTSKARHKKVFSQTKGFRHGRKNLIKQAKQALTRAGQNAYIGRKRKKRVFRRLWIVRLNAACAENGIKYSRFIKLLSDKKIELNRKTLSELAQSQPEEFKKLVEKVKPSASNSKEVPVAK
jgi:large subunit ribosomal protein L20